MARCSATACARRLSRPLVNELITDTWVGAQERTALVTELAAQAARVDAQVVRLVSVAGSPDFTQNCPVGANLAGVAGQICE